MWGGGGGVARRGPTVGLAVRGSRPLGLRAAVCPALSRPRARPTRAYAVVRRTRRRGGVVRGTAVPAGWGRLPRGVAGACCTREATSWSPTSSSLCSLMMLSRSKMARVLWPVRSMATRSGTLARIRLRAAVIVEEAGRHAGRLAGGAPRRAPAPDGDAVVVEDEQAIGVAACPPSRQGFGHGV